MTYTNLKARNSNIEILRILAMFMVLMLHVNFMTIGEPTTAESITNPVPTFFRVFFQMTTNIAVNLFVLISGWFGIRFSYRGLCKFLFQCIIGLYLLARYMHQYGMRYTKYSKYIFIISIIGQVIWFYIPLRIGILRLSYMSILYTSPLCITAALGLLMWFTSFKPRHNPIINFIAASCFSVFLCHICNTWTTEWFVNHSKYIYDSYSGIKYLIAIFTFICGVFLLSILIDQIRKLSWSLIDGFRSSKKRPIADVIQ